MQKIKLYYTNECNSLSPYYFNHFVNNYIDLDSFDNYKSKGSIMLCNPFNENIDKIKPYLDDCKCIIVDNLQEVFFTQELDFLKPYKDKVLLLTINADTKTFFQTVLVPNWMWYFESPWYYSRQYNLYTPTISDNPKLFFMAIRLTKPGRELIYRKLQDILEDSIFSYVDRGITLPGVPEEHFDDQRYFNPDWYNNTIFSVINEDSNDYHPILYSEKTCKALAFYHPFILVAQKGVLKMIKDAGFETFSELFDESYDDIPNLNDRVNFVAKQIRTFDKSAGRLSSVVEKLKYNHNRFFDQDLVFNRVKEEVIYPIINFVNSR